MLLFCEVKLSPQSTEALFVNVCETKQALLRFTVVPFSGKLIFQWECYGHFYDSIKISIFKTVRRLDTTWNFKHFKLQVAPWESWLTFPPRKFFFLCPQAECILLWARYFLSQVFIVYRGFDREEFHADPSWNSARPVNQVKKLSLGRTEVWTSGTSGARKSFSQCVILSFSVEE